MKPKLATDSQADPLVGFTVFVQTGLHYPIANLYLVQVNLSVQSPSTRLSPDTLTDVTINSSWEKVKKFKKAGDINMQMFQYAPCLMCV